MVELDNFVFDLTAYKPNLAILFSGGADSALLFYLSALEIINGDLDKQVTLYVVDRYNKPLSYAFDTYERICKKLDFKKVQLQQITIPTLPNHTQMSRVIDTIYQTKLHDELLIGMNKYPDDITIRPTFISEFKETPFVKIPFKYHTKDALIAAFFKLGIEDILYNTRSCGTPTPAPCKTCFNCRERLWAFNRLGIEPNFGL